MGIRGRTKHVIFFLTRNLFFFLRAIFFFIIHNFFFLHVIFIYLHVIYKGDTDETMQDLIFSVCSSGFIFWLPFESIRRFAVGPIQLGANVVRVIVVFEKKNWTKLLIQVKIYVAVQGRTSWYSMVSRDLRRTLNSHDHSLICCICLL